jgi:Nickel uptake substrate-specific transmembrane region.
MSRARRKWCALPALAAIAVTAVSLQAHDFFFRADSFFVAPGSIVHLRALNGTFSKSENSITRDRLRDLSVVGPAGHDHPDSTAWSTTGDTSVLTTKVGNAGTYVVGASLKPREITLKSADFNKYLADDGIPDVLALRKKNGDLAKNATERYSKHIKALLQVGTKRDDAFAAMLGYPAEIIPMDNPYSARVGEAIRIRAMVDGKPVANQLVVSGGRTSTGGRFDERRVRTNSAGVATIRLNARGQWYVKFIHMIPYTGTDKVDYESKWATLTFEIR